MLAFLSSGSSGSPEELLAALSVDITDPALWAESFAELERQVDEAVAAAAALNRSA
jgi:oligoendopeptidase F